MNLQETCHAIEHILSRMTRPEHRMVVLDWVRSGYNADTGEYIGHTAEQDIAIRCADCERENCTNCTVFTFPRS